MAGGRRAADGRGAAVAEAGAGQEVRQRVRHKGIRFIRAYIHTWIHMPFFGLLLRTHDLTHQHMYSFMSLADQDAPPAPRVAAAASGLGRLLFRGGGGDKCVRVFALFMYIHPSIWSW
jgi:hypothetical protein